MSTFLEILESSTLILIIGLIIFIFKTKINLDFEVKSSIKQDNINEKREVYKHIVESFRLSFSSETNVDNSKYFLNAYDTALLWGSDSVIKKLTYILNHIQEREKDLLNHKKIMEQDKDNFEVENDAIKRNNDGNNKLKKLLAELIIEMRKDLDFNKTELETNDIVFRVFNINK